MSKLTPEQEAYRIQRVREAFKRMGPRPQWWKQKQADGIRKANQRPEVKAKRVAAAKAAWESGRYKITDEGRKKRDEALAMGRKSWKERIDTIRLLSNEKLRGSNGFGRIQRGRPDHANCKEWCVLSPRGKQYRFSNLLEWCRQNEKLFFDSMPTAKHPLWRRAAAGIAQQGQKRGKLRSWQGWVLQNVWERSDPLQRTETPPDRNTETPSPVS